MPTTVQLHRKYSKNSYSYPVFDFLLEQKLKDASLKFRSTATPSPKPGDLIGAQPSTSLGFVVESVILDHQGVVEVNCISVWEYMKRRTYQGYYGNATDTFTIDKLRNVIQIMNSDRSRCLDFNMSLRAPYISYNSVELDPSASIYDLVCDSIAGKNAGLSSTIDTFDVMTNAAVVRLNIINLDEYNPAVSIYYLGSVKASVTRQLPESTTHWMIGKTKDSGPNKISSRGKIRTWAQDRVWLYDDHSYDGVNRNESGIEGDPEKNWGVITVGMKTKPLKTSVVEVEELASSVFRDLATGQAVSFNAFGLYVTGYVLSRKISGGQITTYSIKVQPDRFYEKGRDVTADWI